MDEKKKATTKEEVFVADQDAGAGDIPPEVLAESQKDGEGNE